MYVGEMQGIPFIVMGCLSSSPYHCFVGYILTVCLYFSVLIPHVNAPLSAGATFIYWLSVSIHIMSLELKFIIIIR